MSKTGVVDRAVAGDQGAWKELVRQYATLLRSIGAGFRLNQSEVEDAAQMTWFGLFQHIGKLRDRNQIAGWLSTAMRRNCIRVLRERDSAQLRDDWTQWNVADTSAGIETDILIAERNRMLWQLVDRLPLRQRMLVRTIFADETLSYGEIAEALSIAVGTIGPSRKRALQRLEKLLMESTTYQYLFEIAS